MLNSLSSNMSPFRKSANSDSEGTTKKKRQPLKIIIGNDSQKPTNIISPSRVRQRLSSLFRSSSPVVTAVKDTFSKGNSNLSQQDDRHLSFFAVSFEASATEESPPALLQTLDSNNSITTLSSSSEASDHMPASPADGADTTTSFTKSAFASYHTLPTLPLHQQSLSLQVYQILGSTLDEVDDEIEQDWEHSRNQLRQSLHSIT